MKYSEAICSFCSKPFQIKTKYYNYNIKLGLKNFCNKECRIKFFTKSKNLKCFNCNKDIVVKNCNYKKSKTKRFYCCKTCGAIVNNKGKIHSKKSRIKTSKSIRRYYKKNTRFKKFVSNDKICYRVPKVRIEIPCVICGTTFIQYRNKKCCSRKCSQIYQFGSLPYTKDQLVNKIIEISQKINRTPQKRECKRKLEHSAVKFFGSWNKAISSCGLKPNKSIFQKCRLGCKDGHVADSISEKLVDEWLFKNNIRHERSKKYPGNNGLFNCDFYLPDCNVWIEYFGLIGQVEEYDKGVEIKRQIVKDNNLKFIEIIPSDLYPKNKLDSFLEKIKNAPVV